MLKAESMADKVEWLNKIRNVVQLKGGVVKGGTKEGGLPIRHSLSDGSLVSRMIFLLIIKSEIFPCTKRKKGRWQNLVVAHLCIMLFVSLSLFRYKR